MSVNFFNRALGNLRGYTARACGGGCFSGYTAPGNPLEGMATRTSNFCRSRINELTNGWSKLNKCEKRGLIAAALLVATGAIATIISTSIVNSLQAVNYTMHTNDEQNGYGCVSFIDSPEIIRGMHENDTIEPFSGTSEAQNNSFKCMRSILYRINREEPVAPPAIVTLFNDTVYVKFNNSATKTSKGVVCENNDQDKCQIQDITTKLNVTERIVSFRSSMNNTMIICSEEQDDIPEEVKSVLNNPKCTEFSVVKSTEAPLNSTATLSRRKREVLVTSRMNSTPSKKLIKV